MESTLLFGVESNFLDSDIPAWIRELPSGVVDAFLGHMLDPQDQIHNLTTDVLQVIIDEHISAIPVMIHLYLVMQLFERQCWEYVEEFKILRRYLLKIVVSPPGTDLRKFSRLLISAMTLTKIAGYHEIRLPVFLIHLAFCETS